MHHYLLTDFPTVDAYYADVWSRFQPVNEYRYCMTDEDFYIYQLLHTMKHFSSGGTGIRSVLDVFVYLHAKPSLDLSYIERELTSLGLLTFHQTLVALAETYFGGAALPADLQEVSNYVLGSGTYGVFSQTITNHASTARGGKLGFYLRRAFPGYRFMAEKYPSLRRFPLALPLYWLRRLWRAAFGQNKQMRREVQAVNAVDKEEQKRLDGVMDRVGLRGYR